jgi:hypothetical protein
METSLPHNFNHVYLMLTVYIFHILQFTGLAAMKQLNQPMKLIEEWRGSKCCPDNGTFDYSLGQLSMLKI